MDAQETRLVLRGDRKWEQVVFAEVLLPDVVNTFGDIYTREAIVEFAHEFARRGYGIDIEHDNENVDGTKCYVVESFIVREGDPDFVVGSWVVGMKIIDDDLWGQILAGEINGYSYEALVHMLPVVFTAQSETQVVGVTEPHPDDGHTHDYLVLVDEFNVPISGGTSETDGHSHRILFHTTTEVENGHNHRYQVIADNKD